MRYLSIVLTLAILSVAGPAGDRAVAADALRVSGSTTVYAHVFLKHKDDIEKAADLKLSVVANSSGRGLADLVGGQSDIAMLSSPLADVAKKANVDTASLREAKIGDSRIVFIVHPSNPVKSLTLAQLKDIFAGTIANWKDVGGAPGSILLVAEDPKGGLRTTVEEKVMRGTALAGSARALPNGSQIPTVVKQAPGAIGFASARHDLSGVKVVDTDAKVEQSLFLVTKGDPAPAAARLIQAATRAAN